MVVRRAGALRGMAALLVLAWPAAALGATAGEDRSAAFGTSLARTTWTILANGAERLAIERPGELELVAYRFARARYSLRVLAAPKATGSIVAEVAVASGAVLVINGGYFDVGLDGTLTPTGLLIVDGHEISPLRACRACSGVLEVEAGRGSIVWANGYRPNVTVESAVQTGPLLVEPGGKMGINTPGGPLAQRSAFCISGDDMTVVAVTSRITLYELASLLRSPAPGGLACEAAINLDGGPSTGLVAGWPLPPESAGSIGPVQSFIAIFGR